MPVAQPKLGALASRFTESGTTEARIVGDLFDRKYTDREASIAQELDLNTVTKAQADKAAQEIYDHSQWHLKNVRKLPEEVTVYRAGPITSDVVGVTLDRNVALRNAQRHGFPLDEYKVARKNILADIEAIRPEGFQEKEMLVHPEHLAKTEPGIVSTVPSGKAVAKPAAAEPTGIMTVGAASKEEFMRRYQLLGASKLLEGHTELGAWSAQMMKENPAIPKEDLPEIFDRSKQVINDMQTAGQSTSDIAREIKRQTGQIKPAEAPVQVRPMTALKEMYRQLEAAGKAGVRRGTKEAEAAAKTQRANMLETLRTAEDWLSADVNEMRKKLLEFSRNLPGNERAKFTNRIVRALERPSTFTRDPAVLQRRAEVLLNRMTEKIYDVNVKEAKEDISARLEKIENSPSITVGQKQTARNMGKTFEALKDRMSLDMLTRMHDRLIEVEQLGRDLFALDETMQRIRTEVANREIADQGTRRMDTDEQLRAELGKVLTNRQRMGHILSQFRKDIIPGWLQRLNAAVTPMDWLIEAFDQRPDGAIYRNMKLPIDVKYSTFLDASEAYKTRLNNLADKYKLTRATWNVLPRTQNSGRPVAVRTWKLSDLQPKNWMV